jgi:hypothetical protein
MAPHVIQDHGLKTEEFESMNKIARKNPYFCFRVKRTLSSLAKTRAKVLAQPIVMEPQTSNYL